MDVATRLSFLPPHPSPSSPPTSFSLSYPLLLWSNMAQPAAPTLPVFTSGIDYAGEKEKITTFFTQFIKEARPAGRRGDDENGDEDEGLAMDLDDMSMDGDSEMPEDRKRFKYMKQLVSPILLLSLPLSFASYLAHPRSDRDQADMSRFWIPSSFFTDACCEPETS